MWTFFCVNVLIINVIDDWCMDNPRKSQLKLPGVVSFKRHMIQSEATQGVWGDRSPTPLGAVTKWLGVEYQIRSEATQGGPGRPLPSAPWGCHEVTGG